MPRIFSSTTAINSGSVSVNSSASLTPTNRAASENGPMQPANTSGRDGSFFNRLTVSRYTAVRRSPGCGTGSFLACSRSVTSRPVTEGISLSEACSVHPKASASALRSMADSTKGVRYRACSAATASNWACWVVDRLPHGCARQRQTGIGRNRQRQARLRVEDQPVETVGRHVGRSYLSHGAAFSPLQISFTGCRSRTRAAWLPLTMTSAARPRVL